MRIIAGKYKSRTLNTLKGDTTRPSADRLKESLFNQLGPYFSDETFLDIFAGSGAVGLEALSRGVKSVTMIEKDRKAQVIIEKNLKTLNIGKEANLLKGDAQAVLKTIKEQYDIIFMDPPYDYEHTEKIIHLCESLIKEDGIIIVETDKFKTLPDSINKLDKINEKLYGFAKLTKYEMSQ